MQHDDEIDDGVGDDVSAGAGAGDGPADGLIDDKPSIEHRVVGCLVGAAVGDALGAPFEFGPPGAWSARFPEPVLDGVGEMIGGGVFSWAPGQFTDDTEMAVIVAESLLACSDIDPDDQLTRFRQWGITANDVGMVTGAVLGNGLPASSAALTVFHERQGRGTASNGSIMRAASGAIRFAPGGRDVTMAAGRRLSAVTHADPRCQWAVAIQHELVRCLLAGRTIEHGIASADEVLPDDIAALTGRLLSPEWRPGSGRSERDDPSNGTALGALTQAVWAMRHHGTYADVITAVIDLGGDTDSVAAVAGSLAGARHGIEALPTRWVELVHGRIVGLDGQLRRYRTADLADLALALHRADRGDGLHPRRS